MKKLTTALLCGIGAAMTAGAGQGLQFSKPFQGLEAASVSAVVLRFAGEGGEVGVPDGEWSRTLLSKITDQDFPLQKGLLGFSLPGVVCSVEFRDARGKALRVVKVYGAWNLLSVEADAKSVLGSNRLFAAAVIGKLEESRPEYIRTQRKIYGDRFSGKYEKEYRDILKSEQAGRGDADKPSD